MVIKRIEITNFAGVRGCVSFDMPKILAMCGKNGMGKTTIMNAIRFALTGVEPEGDCINKSSNGCSVKVWLPSSSGDLSFERIKDRDKPSKCKINGKATTLKAMNEKIEDIVGIPIDRIKILSSAELIAAMKPQEFASFILGYIPEKMTLEKVMSFVPSSTIGVMEIMEANLPEEGIDFEVLDAFDEMCRATRKALKSEISAKKLVAEEKKSEKPENDRVTLENRLKELDNIENEYKLYLVKKASYDKAVESLKRIEEQIASIKASADEIIATRPDSTVASAIEADTKKLKESLSGQQNALYGMNSAIGTLRNTLEAINNSVCPISPLIKCSTDKSDAKAEIEESIKATEDGINSVQTEIESINKKLLENEEKMAKYKENENLYSKKLFLLKQAKDLESSKPDVPVAPAEVKSEDVSTETYQIKQALKILDDYDEYIKLTSQVSLLETQLADYEMLIKALSEKGAIRNGIVSAYLGVFEDICNDRSKAIRPDIEFKFVSDNGVVVLMDIAGKGGLPYDSLSGGERAYMIYILIDMLNQLVGTKLLLLDELSVIDEECFNMLLDLVMKYSADYDHIILSAVDHKDTVDALKSHEIPFISNLAELA